MKPATGDQKSNDKNSFLLLTNLTPQKNNTLEEVFKIVLTTFFLYIFT